MDSPRLDCSGVVMVEASSGFATIRLLWGSYGGSKQWLHHDKTALG